MGIRRREFLSSVAAAGGAALIAHTAAAAQSRQGRYSKPVIDLHFHWYPQEFMDLLEKEGAANGARVSRNSRGELVVQTPGSRPAGAAPAGQPGSAGGDPGEGGGRSRFGDPLKTNVDAMLKAMDEASVNIDVLTQTNPHVIWAPPEFGARLARAVNDGNSRLHQKHPDRFIGTITLPMQDVPLALQELERAAKLPGMRAVNLTENVRGKNVGDESFWPVYERCEALGLPIFFKNVDTISERMVDTKYSMMNILSNPFEATMAATSMMLSGALDEFPKLEVYLPHAGGFFAFVNPRIEFARENMNAANFKHAKQPIGSYLRRFHYDLILHSPKLTRTLIDIVGADRVACGTDRPQAMAIKNPVKYVEAIPGVTQKEAEMILCENPARLLKM